MHNYLSELNKVQRQAVENINGPSLVVAGAGSGKTRVLTYKIAHLLNNDVPANSILALTFTNKAAAEMKERVAKITGYDNSKRIWMGTFHSIFARILRVEADKLGYPSNFTIYDAEDTKSTIRAIVKDFNLDKDIYKPNAVYGRISSAKNNLITPKYYAESKDLLDQDRYSKKPEIHRIYKEYAKRCYASGVMDFDDLLLKINVLFRDFKDVLEKYQNIFKYILVDEYQDTNYSQYRIIKELSSKHKNICVVGDDAQSIYSFRGALIENILNYQKDFPSCKVFKLEQNYRSTQNIVNAANSIIEKNKDRIKKNVFSENEEGDKVNIIKAMSDNEEGFLVSNSIADIKRTNNYKYNDFAILYRTNNQSRVFEETFRKRNIPYRIFGGLSFYQRKEVKDVLAYLKVIVNSKDAESIKRIINYPARGIGKTTVDKLSKLSLNNDIPIWEILKRIEQTGTVFNAGTRKKLAGFKNVISELMDFSQNNDAYTLITKVISETEILKRLKSDNTPENINRVENINELINAVSEFVENKNEETEDLSEKTIQKYMEEVSLLTSMDTESDEENDKVTLMTIHSSKGLEYKNVYVVGVEQNLFPNNQATFDPKNLEEERRLFYVALTRAEKHVSVSYSLSRFKYGKIESTTPSQFVNEIDPQFTNNPLEDNFSSVGSSDSTGESYFSSSNKFIKRKTLKPLQKISAENFEPSNPEQVEVGMSVLHLRFGEGEVVAIEGEYPQSKATVIFDNAGKKQLLLKFAKLKIVEKD